MGFLARNRLLLALGFGLLLLTVSILLQELDFLILTDKREIGNYFISSLLKEISFAFLIAFILGISIGIWSKQEHQKLAKQNVERIKRNVFEAVYNRTIPGEFYKELEELIFNQKFVRIDYHMTFRIKKAGKGDYLSFLVNISHKMLNVTNEEIDNVVRVMVENERGDQGDLKNRVLEISVSDESGDERKCSDIVEKGTESDCKVYETKVSFRPEETLSFDILLEQHFPVNFNQPWQIFLMTKNLKITILKDENMSDIDVNITPSFRSSLKPGNVGGDIRTYWANGIILPYQGFIVGTRRIGEENTDSVAAAK